MTYILRRVEAFLRRTEMAPSAFGKLVANDYNLVFQLRDGRDIRPKTKRKILEFLAKDDAHGHD